MAPHAIGLRAVPPGGGSGEAEPLPIVYGARLGWYTKFVILLMIFIAGSAWLILDPHEGAAFSWRSYLLTPWLPWLVLGLCVVGLLGTPLIAFWCPPILRLDESGVHVRMGLRKRWRHWPWVCLAQARYAEIVGQPHVLFVRHAVGAAAARGAHGIVPDGFPSSPFVPGKEGGRRLAERINGLLQHHGGPPSGDVSPDDSIWHRRGRP